MRLSRLGAGAPPFLAMEVAREASARAAAGHHIVRMDVGQPCFGAPKAALAEAERLLRADPLGYTEGLGALALRRAIAAHYGTAYGLDIDPARVVITVGASGAFQLAFLALFDPGERVALAAPGYPPYRHILRGLGFTPVEVEARTEDKLQLSASAVGDLADIAGVLVASPANPTGAMLDAADVAAIARAARAKDAVLISDEIYHGLVYEGGRAVTALALDPDAVIVNSFSKYWAMTGWRIGWLVAPEPLVKPIERLAQSLFIAPPTLAQLAALAALVATDECEANRAAYAQSRRLILEALPGLGLSLAAPAEGAFYALVDVSKHGDDSLALSERLLHEAGVALTPGVDFDEGRGRRWARLAYARQPEEIAEGIARLARVFRA